MLIVEKATIGYCPKQDRVRMDVKSSAGEVARYWFTVRLLSEVTERMFKVLENLDFEVSSSKVLRRDEGGRARERLDHVSFEGGCQEMLVVRADLWFEGGCVVLTCLGDIESSSAQVALTADSAYKWANNLQQFCLEARKRLGTSEITGRSVKGASESTRMTLH